MKILMMLYEYDRTHPAQNDNAIVVVSQASGAADNAALVVSRTELKSGERVDVMWRGIVPRSGDAVAAYYGDGNGATLTRH